MQTTKKTTDLALQPVVVTAALALVAIFFWSYSSAIVRLVELWWTVPDYIYGFLVPAFSGFLLWDRREMLKDVEFRGSFWGIPFFALAAAMRWFAAYYYYQVVDSLSLVPLFAGIVILVGGWQALRWAWPAVVFLTFMVPLPGRYAGMLSRELQQIATSISVFTLQTLGVPAVAAGKEATVIVLTDARLGVVEACSGIRMLMLFFAACAGAALYIRQDLLTRFLIVLSAIPIAIIANVARITVTAILYETASHELAEKIYHDLAGWFMMPLAIGILWLETTLFARLFVTPQREAPIVLDAASPGAHPGRVTQPNSKGEEKT